MRPDCGQAWTTVAIPIPILTTLGASIPGSPPEASQPDPLRCTVLQPRNHTLSCLTGNG